MADITDINEHAPSDPVQQFKRYLANRAIPATHEFCSANGIEFSAANRITEVLGFAPATQNNRPATGIIFKYPGTDYATVRLLGEHGKPLCPKGKVPHAYLPAAVDWQTVSGELIICESPLKALTWTRHGYNAMAAGGVTTVYMNTRQQWCVGFPHAAIESGAITGIRIAWDSDIESNHNVAHALRTLSRALADRHPTTPTTIHRLPAPPEDWANAHKKGVENPSWGCDDAANCHGEKWFAEFAKNLQYSEIPPRDALQDHLDYFNDTYVACLNPEKIINLRTGNFHTPTAFLSMVEPSKQVMGENKPVKSAAIWLSHPDRPTVHGITYQPGRGVVVGEGEDSKYNVWRASPLIPSEGDVGRWLDLLEDAIHDKPTLKLMLSCMAYQVQHRGTRLEKLLYFVGREVGTGKSTQAAIMRRILGDANTGPIDKDQLEGTYNDCWAAKELAILDDVEKLKRGTWSKLKTHITSARVLITQKYVDARTQENYTTFYLSANQADILTTDADERRVLMIHFEPSVLHRDDNDPYWDDFYRWLDEEGGVEAIAHYLGTYDLSNFNPQFHPPMSSIKQEAIESTRDEDEEFLINLRAEPLDYLPEARIVVTSHELYMLMTGEPYHAAHSGALREMSKLIGARMLLKKARPGPILIGGIKSTLYYVPGKSWADEKNCINAKVGLKRLRQNIEDNPLNVLQ